MYKDRPCERTGTECQVLKVGGGRLLGTGSIYMMGEVWNRTWGRGRRRRVGEGGMRRFLEGYLAELVYVELY